MSEIPTLTSDALVMFAGLLLSLGAYVIPPFRRSFDRLGEWKPAFMGGSLFIIATVWQGAVCQWSLNCVWLAMPHVLVVWFAAFGANQGTYLAYVKPDKKKKELKAVAEFDATIANRFGNGG